MKVIEDIRKWVKRSGVDGVRYNEEVTSEYTDKILRYVSLLPFADLDNDIEEYTSIIGDILLSNIALSFNYGIYDYETVKDKVINLDVYPIHIDGDSSFIDFYFKIWHVAYNLYTTNSVIYLYELVHRTGDILEFINRKYDVCYTAEECVKKSFNKISEK